jgi:aryl-alcohol dehydrogenase-like predicted oxidoreductase
MQYRTIAKGALRLSCPGLGCAPMSRNNAAIDDDESIATIHRALDLGVTHFDTSDVYGDGHNETVLGRAFKGRQGMAVIATKWGSKFLPDGSRGRDGSAANAQRSVDASLKRLGLDVIDLYYLHRIDPKVPLEDSIGAMARLVEAGKVRFIGACLLTPEQLRRAHAVHLLTALQSEYSLFERGIETDVLPACRELGVTFVAFSPLWRGIFGGTYYAAPVVHAGTVDRSGDRDLWINRDTEILKPVTELANKKGATPSQIALAWMMAQGPDVIPIPGTRRRKYLEENMKAAEVTLTATEVKSLSDAFPLGIGDTARVL